MISVVILTKNEEHDLPVCLASLGWCDDVHVLDSGSTDRTCEVARDYGAKVSHHGFESFGKQRNYVLDNLDIQHDWVLFLDADEVVTEQFQAAIMAAVSSSDKEVAGFYCCWKMMLEGKWLKRCGNFPKWQFRLLRRGRARFIDFGHGQKEGETLGRIEYIAEPYLHYSFSKGWAQWIERHNKYSCQEAAARLYTPPTWRNVFSRHGSVRNPALKSWFSRVPGWPVLHFLQAYVFNLGFLEGTPGLIYCINMSYHEFLIQIKMREIRKGKYNLRLPEYENSAVKETLNYNKHRAPV